MKIKLVKQTRVKGEQVTKKEEKRGGVQGEREGSTDEEGMKMGGVADQRDGGFVNDVKTALIAVSAIAAFTTALNQHRPASILLPPRFRGVGGDVQCRGVASETPTGHAKMMATMVAAERFMTRRARRTRRMREKRKTTKTRMTTKMNSPTTNTSTRWRGWMGRCGWWMMMVAAAAVLMAAEGEAEIVKEPKTEFRIGKKRKGVKELERNFSFIVTLVDTGKACVESKLKLMVGRQNS